MQHDIGQVRRGVEVGGGEGVQGGGEGESPSMRILLMPSVGAEAYVPCRPAKAIFLTRAGSTSMNCEPRQLVA